MIGWPKSFILKKLLLCERILERLLWPDTMP